MTAPADPIAATGAGTTRLALAAFAAGLAAVGWIAAGYVATSPLALAAVLLIAAAYLAGGLELRRFHQATGALRQALQRWQAAPAPATPEALAAWLAQLPAALQPAVRSRIDGGRAPLPGPVLAPYLVGLLVLLGMLGTFVGMVATLKGAAAALQAGSDLATIRSALMAPVQGLGLAFGTSVAGVAASAALGLVSALCRRARLQAGQLLDACIAERLQPLTAAARLAAQQAAGQAQQAEGQAQLLAALQALAAGQQQQAAALPALAGEFRAAVQALAQQQQALGAQLLAGQQQFHADAQATHAALARSVGQSLQDALAESARLAGATIAPAVDSAVAGITRETAALHGRIADLVQRQLDGLAARFGQSVDSVAATWQTALAQQQQDARAHAAALQAMQTGFSGTLAQQGRDLLAAVETGQQRQQAQADERQRQLLAEVAAGWQAALAQQQASSAALRDDLGAAQAAHGEALARQSTGLLAAVDGAQRQLLTDLAARDAQRLDALAAPLQAMAERLQQDWLRHGAEALAQQQALAGTLQAAVQAMHADASAQTRATAAEIGRLLQAAGEAPRAAAEALAALRQQLADSLARDQALQQERAHTAATLRSLLDEVAQAAAAQRTAIDALVAGADRRLQDAAGRLDAQAAASAGQAAQAVDRVAAAAGQVAAASERVVDASGRIAAASEQVVHAADRVADAAGQVVDASGQVAAGSIELASLGEAFGAAVGQFGDGNQALVGQLAQVEAALARSQQRSDEQLAYYVAQAREIIELSLLSQKQIVDELQRTAGRAAA